jgi:hypothetical protein
MTGTVKISFYFMLLALFAACGNDTNTDNHSLGHDTLNPKEDTLNQHMLMSLPTPLQIAETYQKAGLKFIPNITNPVENMSRYASTYSRSLNLGVYTADLAYCILNDQTQAALLYLKTAKQLAQNIGLVSVYETSAIVSRFEQNMNNTDSLEAIMRNLDSESSLFLNEGDKKTQAIIIFSGVWVESIYMASAIVQNDKNKAIISLIGKQKKTLDVLVSLLGNVNKTDVDISSLLNDLKGLKEYFETIEAIGNQNTQSRSFEISISDEELAALHKRIAELRGKIIS